MDTKDWAKILFKSIDELNADAFLAFLTEDVTFRFGNLPAVHGKADVSAAVNGFFGSIKAMNHDLTGIWKVDDVVICQGTVNYTRQDSSTLSVPFANIFKMNGNLIREYLIYVDISQL